ncbi:hypothetical protein DNU06_10905 [Putridiphycobacter roseus]|uniref:Protein BatD n=1 Tax=Putridiphycobacter roseus TaxID=2219161 RepID=A0A2W1N1F0_9FLAO|nr:BatD family protein [Putridiphycobacter roseus]PZE16761.1 hypothetical protein DNU06_10905 [Putridiphycobacter roseus]
MKQFCLHILLLLSVAFQAHAQTGAQLTLTNDTIRIGDQLRMDLSFTLNEKADTGKIIWPEFDNFLTDNIEITKKGALQKGKQDSTSQLTAYLQQFILTGFDIGTYPIPSIEIKYDDSTFLTNPAQLSIVTVAVDTSKGIYDNKPIFEVDYTLTQQMNDWFKDNWYWIIIGLLMVVLVILIFKFKNRPKEIEEVPVPKIPAHITALSVLKSLEKNQAWLGEDKKLYYSEVTDVLRKYLEERFDILALEKTTVEVIKDLKYTDILSKDKFFLQEILRQADLVKFAKFKPADEDGAIVLNKSIEFVERTKEEMEASIKNKTKPTDDVQ